MQNASVANFIGKEVSAAGNTTYLSDTADINYALTRDAASVELSILGPQGGIVWSKNIGAQGAGEYTYAWDGYDFNGSPLPKGTYTFKVDALDSSGMTVGATSISTGSVTGVVFRDGATFLELDDGRRIHLSEINSIQERRI
jgi:flagellar basal-body rod modification protein FlgD